MRYQIFILAVSVAALLCPERTAGCGPYYTQNAAYIKMFRSCSPELERQWQEGCRFQEYEKDENCLLWQSITMKSIPLRDIEEVIYALRLADLKNIAEGDLAGNSFARWLSAPEHREDLEYVLVAKEIEELRSYMNNAWYYPYDGDEEHARLDELMARCRAYGGSRHAARYGLQMARLYFAAGNYKGCIDLWEKCIAKMPRDIVTDMTASYAGGAYLRCGDRAKAIKLYTRSGDIGSLISAKAWGDAEAQSEYTDPRVKELEYIFNRFPDSPLLSVKLQQYVRLREDIMYKIASGDGWYTTSENVKINWVGDSVVVDSEEAFYDELKRFARNAAGSAGCHQKGMWLYALGYLHYLDGDTGKAEAHLSRAERAESTPFIRESIRAFRFMTDAMHADNSAAYRKRLQGELAWLDSRLEEDMSGSDEIGWHWQYKNRLNYSVSYWQNVARKALLGEVCPRVRRAGNSVLALQLANYAVNRANQLRPLYEAFHYGKKDTADGESYYVILPFEEYRKDARFFNFFDFSNQFFDRLYGSSADEAAAYVRRVTEPASELDIFLNERGYVDTDYLYEIVGTLYLREMNYDKAAEWLAGVSADYQQCTNLAKEGFFRLDPFRYQFDKKYFIDDSNDYKLRFAQEMLLLEKIIESGAEPNRKAEAKIRYAIGLRNSFGKCWYLTGYSYSVVPNDCTSSERNGFKDNVFAQKAYERVDALTAEARREFTDPEKAAAAELAMLNFRTLVEQYGHTTAAQHVRSCDNYRDYALQAR